MVKLLEPHGETSVFLEAEINKEGDLVLSGQNLGKAPREVCGDCDYEYRLTVRSEHKDKVLQALIKLNRRLQPYEPFEVQDEDQDILALLQSLFGGHSRAFSEFRDFLNVHGIPSEIYG